MPTLSLLCLWVGACSRQSREWSSLKVALRKALTSTQCSVVVFALFDGVYLEKGSKWASVNRLTDCGSSRRVCYPGEHIVGFRTDQAVCDLTTPTNPLGEVVLLPVTPWVRVDEGFGPCPLLGVRVPHDSYLVDPASSHMLVSKIKPCMSKYKQLYTVKLQMAH